MILYYSPEDKNIVFKIKRKLNVYGCVVLKNFLKKNTTKKIFNYLKKNFYSHKDIRVSGPFRYLQKDYKRLDIGNSYINPRFSRFLLLTEWNKKNNKLYSNLYKVFNLRNKLCKLQKKKFEYSIKGYKSYNYKWCEMVRMIQYPVGGGFLSEHKDEEVSFPKQMINVLMILSNRGKKRAKFNNFSRGGLYYKKRNKLIDIEKIISAGDLVFHNQKIYHGVNSIDPESKIDLKTLNGRVTLNFSVGKFFTERSKKQFKSGKYY